jgi:hypothetical protein
MSLLRLTLLLACATSLTLLPSCQFGESADAVNPTVAEMDSLDLQWGLPARKSKGGPRRTYQYMDGAASAAAASAPSQAPAVAPARETVNTPPPATATPAPAPAPAAAVPANLR